MNTAGVVLPVLTFLFHRLEERFNGRPTLLILDEAWVFLDNPLFAARIREWLKVLRKKNVSVVFATQSLADIADRSEEHTSELQSLMRISYAVFCLKKKPKIHTTYKYYTHDINNIHRQATHESTTRIV